MPENPLSTMNKIDQKFMDHIKATGEFVYADGALPAKVKFLIAMAFDAAHGAADGVKSLAQSAIKAGAAKEEIAEALRVAYHLCGVGSLYTAALGLRELFPSQDPRTRSDA